MSEITAKVTNGKVYTEDASNLIELTKDNLNALGKPSVVVELGNAVTLSDLTSDATTGMPKATLTVASESANAVQVDLQMLDGKSVNLGEKCVVDVWLSDVAGEAKTGTAPDGGVAMSTGIIIDSFTAVTHFRLITDASGKAVFSFTHTGGALTKFINAKINDKYIAGSQSLAWLA